MRIDITYQSAVRLNGGKSNPLASRVTKTTKLEGAIFGVAYADLINEGLAKEGKPQTFVSQGRRWGVFIKPNCVIEHKGEHYLSIKTDSESASSTTYFVDGRLATDAEIADIKATLPKSGNATQDAVGLTNQIFERDVKVSNIVSIVAEGAEVPRPILTWAMR